MGCKIVIAIINQQKTKHFVYIYNQSCELIINSSEKCIIKSFHISLIKTAIVEYFDECNFNLPSVLIKLLK